MAERVGVEPTWRFRPSDFESAPLWPLRYLSGARSIACGSTAAQPPCVILEGMPQSAGLPLPLFTRCALAAAGLLLSACPQVDVEDNRLNAVKRAGEIVVLTRNSPTTYYEGPEGPTGFEYDLAHAFADRLGVNLRMKSVPRFADILPMMARGEADFAAAGLTVTPQRAEQLRFTPHYQIIRQEVVHNTRAIAPKDVQGLIKTRIDVPAGTSYVERLEELKRHHPKLAWFTVSSLETEELLQQVQEGLTEITIADSNILAISRQLNPDLRVAFTLGDPEKLAWAFPPGDDDSLYKEAARFLEGIRGSNEFNQLVERHYGDAHRFNPVNIAAFLQKIESDLPRYKPLFMEAARRNALDWRLLAALSYQESYWDPAAVSPTGVRGIMMLTEITAQHLGISNRLDVHQSVHGGAVYLRTLRERIPAQIPEPDRTWMALASYNVGFNHVEDARIITQSQGASPDKWNDVKERLPLLAKSVWFNRARHGYARGYEPVQFVDRIRSYHEALKKNDDESRTLNSNDALRLKAPAL